MTVIDEYIEQFPTEVKTILIKLKSVILKAAPSSSEMIKYGIPTFYLEGNLVHFAAYKHHIGFYPAPSGLKAFQKEINQFQNSKGAVQFPIDKPLPYDLITKIVKFRVKENIAKAVPNKQQFIPGLSAPAVRALENAGIKTIKQLAKYSEKDILALHGIGPSSILKLKLALAAEKLSFKKNKN